MTTENQTNTWTPPRWKTNYNAHTFPTVKETNYAPSMTVPHQALSMKEIMTRYAQGLGVDGIKVPVYNGEEDMAIDLKRLDLAEIQMLKEENAKTIVEMRRDMQRQAENSSSKYKDQEIPFEEINTDESNPNRKSNSSSPSKDSKSNSKTKTNQAPEIQDEQ